MSDLKTSFAGLELKNPVIVSSCGRTSIPANNKKLEEAGAGAIVLKSLFEENKYEKRYINIRNRIKL